jgi:D-3-phosphoglycerate dehydrogenase
MSASLLRAAGAATARAARRALASTSSSASTTEYRLRVKTFNKISPNGLSLFPDDKYSVSADHTNGQAILLRSHKLKPEDVPLPVRCIARCGAGTNNCQVDLMTQYGIPVFNTPGSNANAVKELVLCSLFLASRGILAGANHMKCVHLSAFLLPAHAHSVAFCVFLPDC